MKQDLEQFLSGVPETGRWLLIDSSAYLPLLCQHFPEAGITAVTRFDEVPALREFEIGRASCRERVSSPV